MPQLFPNDDLHAVRRKYKPDAIKGDMDSVRDDVVHFYKDLGTTIVDASHDQDTTDLHKCVLYIHNNIPDLQNSNLCILVVGALGGRFDHELGNINVLYNFSTVRLILLNDDCLIQLLPCTHRHEIHIDSHFKGQHCGLAPVGMPSRNTTTTGLQWNLSNTEMKFGGLVSTSNIVRENVVTVHSDADLIWTMAIKKK
ncbi:OLC1v1032606C2 [Oldenlandia corymbosa var. corymbosa]|nr:OLC1v1032606C2 [Oldenlandia corymbosa var. corymbosa]